MERAADLGTEIYVVDTGWYTRTGDWDPDNERFHGSLERIQRKIASYGMKMGIWFAPPVVSFLSRTLREHPEWQKKEKGKAPNWGKVWDKEDESVISSGFIGSSPEIYEKIDPKTGNGMVIAFTETPRKVRWTVNASTYEELTVITGSCKYELGSKKELILSIDLKKDDVVIIFISVKNA